MYIVLYSATMLMIGPSTFLEDEDEDGLKNSFFPRTIPMWNSLPSSVVSSKTIEEFKAQI